MDLVGGFGFDGQTVGKNGFDASRRTIAVAWFGMKSVVFGYRPASFVSRLSYKHLRRPGPDVACVSGYSPNLFSSR